MSIKKISFFFLIGFIAVLFSNNGHGMSNLKLIASASVKASVNDSAFTPSSEVKNYDLTAPSLTEQPPNTKKEVISELENQSTNYAFALFEKNSIYPSIYKIQAISKAKNYLGFLIKHSAENNINLTDKNNWICFSIYDLKPDLLQTIHSNNTLIFDLKQQFDLPEKVILDLTIASLGEILQSKKPPDHPPIPWPVPMPYHYELVDSVGVASVERYEVTVPFAFSDEKNRETTAEKTTDITFKQWIWGSIKGENTDFSNFFQNFTDYFIPCEETLSYRSTSTE